MYTGTIITPCRKSISFAQCRDSSILMQNFFVGSFHDEFESDSEDSILDSEEPEKASLDLQNSEEPEKISLDLQNSEEPEKFSLSYGKLLKATQLDPSLRCVLKIGKSLVEFNHQETLDHFSKNYDSISHISDDELEKMISGRSTRESSLIECLLRPDTLNDPVFLSLDTIKRHLLVFRRKGCPITKFYGLLNSELSPGGVFGSPHTRLQSGKTYILIKDVQTFLKQSRTNFVDYFYLLAKGLEFNQVFLFSFI